MKQLFITFCTSAILLNNAIGQFVVTAPALETEMGIQNQNSTQQLATSTQTLTETINQSGTLSNMQTIQQQVLDIYKKSTGAIQQIQTFVSVMQNLDQIKNEISQIGKYETLAKKQGIDLPSIFRSLENKFVQCTDLVNSATKEDMTPAERIKIVVDVASMLENIIGSIAGVKTNIINNIQNNILTNTIKQSLGQCGFGPNVLNFKTK